MLNVLWILLDVLILQQCLLGSLILIITFCVDTLSKLYKTIRPIRFQDAMSRGKEPPPNCIQAVPDTQEVDDGGPDIPEINVFHYLF